MLGARRLRATERERDRRGIGREASREGEMEESEARETPSKVRSLALCPLLSLTSQTQTLAWLH